MSCTFCKRCLGLGCQGLELETSNFDSCTGVTLLFAKLVLMCHGIKSNGVGERGCAMKKNLQKERLAAEQVEDINTSLESGPSLGGGSCRLFP